MRAVAFLATATLFLAALLATIVAPFSGAGWVTGILGVFTLLGIWDLLQKQHALFRNYPLIGHFRPLLESIRPQVRQYFIESDIDGAPFTREQRALVYQRAKGVQDHVPFGTELSVCATGYEWLNHSIQPAERAAELPRVTVGGAQCTQPYSMSLLNVSAMSFGALSANAILALNEGARRGHFAHDTGEGGLSPYHLRNGGDLIWEIGSGYFSCRDPSGRFDEQRFVERAAHAQVKMIEIKLSQGAKPGHGGVLPGRKVTAEIAEIRGVPSGFDCISPAAHSAFGSPTELLQFIDRLRRLGGGKPVGFKLCIGHPIEFLSICKAMVTSGLAPDFVVVDGKEGGTGAAPLEFSDHVGTPLREGLLLVHNMLTAVGQRAQVRVGASGKIISAFDMAVAMGVGADWCNSARGFMFSLGCLQSQRCHTDRCPVGVATQDPSRQRGLDVLSKAERVARFHATTVHALMELVAAAGVDQPAALRAKDFYQRESVRRVLPLDEIYTFSEPGELLGEKPVGQYAELWNMASADRFSFARDVVQIT